MLARVELCQPGVGFLGRDVQAGRLIVCPCAKQVLPELLALLNPFHMIHSIPRIALRLTRSLCLLVL